MKQSLLIAPLFLVCSSVFSQKKLNTLLPDAASRANLSKNLSLVQFVPNLGQYPENVLYTFNTPQVQMLLFKDRIRMISFKRKSDPTLKNKHGISSVLSSKEIVDISFPGSNELRPRATGSENASTYNFFSGSRNITGIRSSSELLLENIYSGIALKLYSNQNGGLEFDWIINDPLNYKKVRMLFSGQRSLHVNKRGDLLIKLRSGSLKLRIPETYQLGRKKEKIKLASSFSLFSNSEAGYKIDDRINPRMPLVIDPVLMWGSFMDGNKASFDAYLFGGTRDANGDIYVCGGSQRITDVNIQTVGYGSPAAGYRSTPYTDTSIGATGAGGQGLEWLIMKVKADGSQVLTYTFFGLSSTSTTSSEQAHCISISPNGGSVFVGGFCNSSTGGGLSLPALSPAYASNTAFGGTSSTVDSIPAIAVFTPDLASLKYRTFIGNGAVAGDVTSIEALNDNDFIVASWVGGSLGNGAGAVAYASGPDNSFAGVNDIYIAKFTNFNTRTWGTYVGGNGDDEVFDMRLQSNGDVAFCGQASSTTATMTTLLNEVASTANRNASTATSDALVGIIKADGSAFNMLSMVGGSSADEFDGLESGNCDTLYIAGTTGSTNFPNVGASVMQTSKGTGTNTDMILFKCASTGGTAGTTACYYGGTSNDIGNSIAFLPVGRGKVFVFGSTQSNAGMNPANNIAGNSFYNSTYQGGAPVAWDMFFIECSPDFRTKYLATYVGGNGADYLGNTGAQVSGKQMMLLSDSAIGIYTTTHTTGAFSPNILSASGVFDNSKSNTNNDTWILFALNIKDGSGPIDAGDAPISYGKAAFEIDTSAGNARISLGNRADADSYYPGSPGSNTDFDNNEGNSVGRKPGTSLFYNPGASGSSTIDDEDALSSIAAIFTGDATYNLNVPYYNNSGQTCSIYGFIDFNIDGDFNDANEKVSITGLASNANAAGTAGRIANLTWTIPGGIIAGNSFIRIIIVQGTGSGVLSNCPGGLGYIKNQAFGVGEVEDYKVTIISSALPVTLVNFNAVKQPNSVLLKWQTASELNTAYFEVEKSVTGFGFTSIGRVSAQGSSNVNNYYRLTDNQMNLTSGYYYYRLKIVDANGNFRYSQTVRISADKPAMIATANPNPFYGMIKLQVESAEAIIANITVHDINGKQVSALKYLLQTGSNNISITDTENLQDGTYYISVSTTQSRQMIKAVKLR